MKSIKRLKENLFLFFKGLFSNSIFLFNYVLLLLSLTLKIWSWNKYEWFKGADYLFDFFINLQLGIFVSIFFYILIVYIPNKEKEMIITEEINYSISKTLSLLLLQINYTEFSLSDNIKLNNMKDIKFKNELLEFFKEQREKLKYDFDKTFSLIIKDVDNFLLNYEILMEQLKIQYSKSIEYIDFSFHKEIEELLQLYKDINAENSHIKELRYKGSDNSYSFSTQKRNVSNFILKLKSLYDNRIPQEYKDSITNMVIIELLDNNLRK